MLYVKNRGIAVASRIKYLGLIMDGDLNFLLHFEYVAGKVDKTIRLLNGTLNGILPNCKRPKERQRKLYLNVVLSVILYGSLVWCREFRNNI